MFSGKYIGTLFSITVACMPTQGVQPKTMTPCTPSIEPGIIVSVSDVQTKAPLQANVVIKDGKFTEELQLNGVTAAGQIMYGGAFERPGVYTVTVSKDGYNTAVLKEVNVTKGECHVMTRNLNVTLKRKN